MKTRSCMEEMGNEKWNVGPRVGKLYLKSSKRIEFSFNKIEKPGGG